MTASYFVVGTDTGVGKTTISVGILASLQRRGISVAALKPAETGCIVDSTGALLPQDGLALQQASQTDLPLDIIVPHTYRTAVAPSVAAEIENKPFCVSRVGLARDALLRLQPRLLLVEGAGGLLSPYAPAISGIDLAQWLGLPLLIVARSVLGTINHTILTIRASERRQLVIAGIILNRLVRKMDHYESSNPREIEKRTGVPVLGTVAYIPASRRQSPADIANVVEQAFDPLTTLL